MTGPAIRQGGEAPPPVAGAEPSARDKWECDDDELLLLDELEDVDEAPTDERDGDVM